MMVAEGWDEIATGIESWLEGVLGSPARQKEVSA
jgi:hypothetical protein